MNWTDDYPDWGDVPKDADVPDACFAYVPEDESPSARKLPYQFERDGTIYVHPVGVSLALAAIGPNPPHGQPVAIPAAKKAGVRAKLLAAKTFVDNQTSDEEQVEGGTSVKSEQLADLEAVVGSMEDGETKDRILAEINKLSEASGEVETTREELDESVLSMVGIASQLLAKITGGIPAADAYVAAEGAHNILYAIRDSIRALHPEVVPESSISEPKLGANEPSAREGDESEPELSGDEAVGEGNEVPLASKPNTDEPPTTVASESVKGNRLPVKIVGRIISEATGEAKDTYRVCLIESGTGKNGHRYPAEFLKANAAQYEGKRMFLDHQLTESAHSSQEDQEVQVSPKAKDFVSAVQNVRFDPDYECQTPDGQGAIVGEAKIFDSAFRDRMAYPEFRREIGLSHCIYAIWDAVEGEQGIEQIVEMEVDSIDWVMSPAQGGRVLEHATQKEDVDVSGYEEQLKVIERKQRAIETRAAAQMIVESDVGLTPKLRQKIVEMVTAVQDGSAVAIDAKVVTEAAIADMRDTISEATGPARPGVSSQHSIEEFVGINEAQFKDGAAGALVETIFGL